MAEASTSVLPDAPPLTLSRLPRDALLLILQWLEPVDLVLSVSRACSALHVAAALDDGLWKALLVTRYSTLLHAVFAGVAPPPRGPVSSWRAHYFRFGATWMNHALQSAGRVIMIVDGELYDVTPFLDGHPGGPELLSDAAGTDATAVFDAVGHSPNARRILQRYLLPDLHLPKDESLRPRAQPSASGWSGAAGLVAEAIRGGEERRRLRKTFGSMLHAVWGDLTEGRPDCRRLSPAVWRLAMAQRASLATPV
jgi:hypothetical protein